MQTAEHLLPSFSKTRLAPTPSGYLHLGNVLSFVLTLGLARKAGAQALLRIDDMDRERAAPHFVQDVFDTLRFLEMPWNQGPKNATDHEAAWSQRYRLPLYNEALEQLVESGRVFACTCSRKEILQQSSDGGYPGTCCNKGISLHTPGATWRIKTPDDFSMQMKTLTGHQTIIGLPPSTRHFVVRKKDGLPAYQLCSLLDDVHFGVDLIVRGLDLWPSTLAQLYLSTLLPHNSFAGTVFVHHPLLKNEDGEKLSKSAGSTSVFGLRKEGKSKEEIFALLSRLVGLPEAATSWIEMADVLMAQPALLGAAPA